MIFRKFTYTDCYDLMLAIRCCLRDGGPVNLLPRMKESKRIRAKVLHQLRHENWAFPIWKKVRSAPPIKLPERSPK
jgi:hypothetical protein